MWILLVAAPVSDAAYVELTDLSAKTAGSRVVVEVAVDGDSWSWMSRNGVRGYLDIEVIDGRGNTIETRRRAMSRPSSHVSIDVGRADAHTARVSVAGGNAGEALDHLLLSGVAFRSVDLWLQGGAPSQPVLEPEPEPEPPSWDVARLITVCGGAFTGDDNESTCVEVSRAYTSDPEPFIALCGAGMDGDANELACLQLAAGTPSTFTDVIEACLDTMGGDDNELACIEIAARGNAPDARGVVNACAAQMDGDEAEVSCIAASVGGLQTGSVR